MHVYKELMQCTVNQFVTSNQVVNKSCLVFASFEAYKMAGFVRRRKKWAKCVSNRCKNSFKRKNIWGVRGTLTLIRLWIAIYPVVALSSLRTITTRSLHEGKSETMMVMMTCIFSHKGVFHECYYVTLTPHVLFTVIMMIESRMSNSFYFH